VNVARAFLVAVAVMLGMSASASAATIPGRYIVVLKDSVDDPGGVVRQHDRKHGFRHDQLYRYALTGYAAGMSAEQAETLRSDPRVLSVEQDRELRSAAKPPPPPPAPQPAQVPSRAIFRIGADLSSTRSGDGSGSVPINVAVLDGGVDVDHPDLNVVGGKDCASHGPGFDDQDGHGTMVAGFIGARDNSIGRVGVAPGARIWSVRTANPKGYTPTSRLICGLDFVASTRLDSDPGNDIAVANMSLGGPLTRQGDTGSCLSARSATHVAVCRVFQSGTVLVASAGNETADLGNVEPATYDEVLAVTAIADEDGQPGALGGPLCEPTETDDAAATFSNFATLTEDQLHTVAAPGVCIGSTFIDGQFALGSGTSFAAPLVAGSVALCIHSGPCAGLTPAQIIHKIVADAAAYNEANPGYGFQGDPLRPIATEYYGYLIRAALY
jgi:subtilisin